MGCGQCVPACPHDAIEAHGDLARAAAVAAGGNGALILAPEAAAHFYPAKPEQVVNACQAAGFRVVTRGVIGVQVSTGALSKEAAQAHGLPNTNGAVLSQITAGGPAAKAGLEPGDVIVEFNGRPVIDSDALVAMVVP